jgi:Flp pilus assembly protein TadB
MMDIIPLCVIAFIVIFSKEYVEPFFESFLMTVLFWCLIGSTFIGSIIIRMSVKKMKNDCGV